MNIIISVVFSLALTCFGFTAVQCYFNNGKEKKELIEILRINSIEKILYLAIAIGVSCVFPFIFEKVYEVSIVKQLKLLSLIHVILASATVDWKIQKIPNRFLIIALVIRCFVFIFEFFDSPKIGFQILIDSGIGALVIGLFFLVILLISKNSIGMGDVKLFAIMGLFQGLWGAVNSVFFSLLVAFFYSIVLLVTKKKSRKDTISFGPCILLGTIVAIGLTGM